MFRRMLMALTMFGALSVAGLGVASTVQAHCGGGYYGGYAAYYGPSYYGPGPGAYYAGYPTAVYAAPYPYASYPRYYRHHHHHDGVVVSFGF